MKLILVEFAPLFLVFLNLWADDSGRPERPNVVIILADDLGWQDVGCYDIDEPSPMETPNIDDLAKRGVLFRQGYSPAPTCAPTRIAIMTGKHPAVTQKTHVAGGNPPTPYKKTAHPLMDPWYSGRMKLSEITIAEVLKNNGYKTGHSGKWHMAIDHNAFPQPEDQGFDFTRHDLGESRVMKPHRLTGFATNSKNDPFRLDEKGFPKDQMTLDAIEFMEQCKAEPFFLYYSAWLVHTPIHSRSKALLEKYCEKLRISFPHDPNGWELKGQNNPYYCAMVEMFDHYVGQIISYLSETEDPRWKGHKLIENTYIIFTSDNGGMEQVPGEIITDNYPLDRGKISLEEGGVRVPFIICGPDIKGEQESKVMVNGLDFYPTILSWTNTEKPSGVKFDGCNLSYLLKQNPQDYNLVIQGNGKPRETMIWHFPHGVAQESTIRENGWKLIYNYMPGRPHLQLYQLYENYPLKPKRIDIEESENLAEKFPQKAELLRKKLFSKLSEMNASYPFLNPSFKGSLPHKEKICVPLKHEINGRKVSIEFKTNGSNVDRAQISYTLNGGQKFEEWYITEARIKGNKVIGELPINTTHYVFNLIDEHNFLISYPEMPDKLSGGNQKDKIPYSKRALKLE